MSNQHLTFVANKKICAKCTFLLSHQCFSKSQKSKDGVRSRCKECTKVTAREYRSNNKEKAHAASAAWARANAKRMRELKLAWAKANPERTKANQAAWRLLNLEEVKSKAAAYRKINAEKGREHVQTRRFRKINQLGVITLGIKKRLFSLQNGKCPCCALPLGDDYHLDHIMPLVLGGLHDDGNLQLMRAGCNQRKGTKHPIDYMQSKGRLI